MGEIFLDHFQFSFLHLNLFDYTFSQRIIYPNNLNEIKKSCVIND